jgi:hypothetical protein
MVAKKRILFLKECRWGFSAREEFNAGIQLNKKKFGKQVISSVSGMLKDQ